MSRSLPDLRRLTQDIVTIATHAGAVVMEVFASNFEVRAKADKSPVTVADERAEAFIVEHLGVAAPGIPVVGEEGYAPGRFSSSASSHVAFLLFLSRVARPDISVAAQRLCRVVTTFATTHYAKLFRLHA